MMPEFKTIANFRKDNDKAIRGVCRPFVVLVSGLACSLKRWRPSMVASSRRSTIATAASPAPSFSGVWKRSSPALTVT
ncbi:hypothetical protein PSEUDO9AG_40615 [Pseudomonas sp. 9Ag]|nr:hypothetical protein PSEUDO9AG_40615 [Pseudomonas sp. 9Ag]